MWRYVGPVKAVAVYRLKVLLIDSKPLMWRRLLVRDDATLEALHVAIQIAFGWMDCHMHQFEVGDRRIMVPPDDGFDEFFEEGVEDGTKVRLDELGLKPRSRFTYTYDFGDNWTHGIVVEKVLTAKEAEDAIAQVTGKAIGESARTPVAVCVDGERHGPLEDCGGVWGWEETCAILSDPKHPEHEERKEWAEADIGANGFDPALFELKPVNADLLKVLKR